MLLKHLREEVLEANLELVRRGLVLYTFGNASAISREDGLVVIKPSGVPYEQLRPESMVVTRLDGTIAEGEFRPSSDLPTHLVLYKAFAGISGIAHTHSEFAVAWAQAGKPIPCLGTTHADYFHGAVPVTETLTAEEISSGYEVNTGHAIVRAFKEIEPMAIPAALVRNHASFTWGVNAAMAAHNSVVLEAVAKMAYYTIHLNSAADGISETLHNKHFLRKHGPGKYYGQDKK